MNLPNLEKVSKPDLYFIFDKDQQAGPFSFPQLLNLWRNGNIQADAKFWLEGYSDWEPISQLGLDASDTDLYNAHFIFVFDQRSRQHLGPFCLRELRNKLDRGESLEGFIFCWPGLKKWMDLPLFFHSINADKAEFQWNVTNDFHSLPPTSEVVGQAGAIGYQTVEIGKLLVQLALWLGLIFVLLITCS